MQSAIVDPERLDCPLIIIFEVKLKAETAGAIDVVKQNFADAPEVRQCYYANGETNFVLIIVMRDMGEYAALPQRLFFSNDTIPKFKTFVTMGRAKINLSIDI
ncbi:Lrp/AsnC family transcriptional regulator [Tateyamaria sp.]|uniref:Lrp/AsnC family transcriptional regulator n=1 Tax=Tateyamaria sp. TaxID=1929288 RepID=UPI00329B5B91